MEEKLTATCHLGCLRIPAVLHCTGPGAHSQAKIAKIRGKSTCRYFVLALAL
jgi:hypothetical protein